MVISVINHSNGQVSDDELQRVIRAINRQIKEDFEREERIRHCSRQIRARLSEKVMFRSQRNMPHA